METKFKKLLPLAGVLCGFMTTFLHAAQGDSQKCPTPAGKISDYHEGRFREITPNAGPRVQDGVDVFITADFIYWRAGVDGLGYAVSGMRNAANPAPVVDATPGKGDVKHPDFEFDPGFKVGLGLNLSHDGWDIFAQYTWLYTGDQTDSTSQSQSNTSTLRPTWFVVDENGNVGSPSDVINRASSTWKLRFNVIDLELGRNFFVSQYLTLRPHFGLKGTWQEQNFSVRYTEFDAAAPFTDPTDRLRMTQDHDWWGVGVRTGFNTAWHFTRSWSIFGNVALSALWGEFDVDRRDRTLDLTDANAPELTNFHTENDFHTIKPVLELALGLRWETWFSDDDYHFSIEAGWEQQVWWNQNQMYRHFEESSHGDLTLQGLTLHLRFDF